MGSGKFLELTYEEIKTLYLKEKNGGAGAKLTNEKIPTLFEVMNLVRERQLLILINAGSSEKKSTKY